MSKQKGSGPDNITTMLWKGHSFDAGLLYFCNETLEGNKPSALKSTLKTIYDYHTEKVNLSQPSRRIIEEIKIANRKASTDLDYEDDIALLFHQINNAEILLQSLETAAHKVGLTLNSTKTECMLLNQEFTGNEIHTLNGHL